MKKFLLSLAAVSALSASADKAVIICDGAQIMYGNELPADAVVVPYGWDAKNDGGVLVCNAAELKFTDPSSFASRNGAIRWAKNKSATLTPTAGITITKVTTHTATTANMGSWGDNWVTDGLLMTLTPADGTQAIEMKPGEQNRVNWIEIEYSGTPTQVLPAIAKSFDLAQPGKLTFESATPGATIHYTLDGTAPTADSPVAANGEVAFTGDVLIKTIAVKDGMTNSFVYQQPAMAAQDGASVAAFYFPQYPEVTYLKEGVPTAVTTSLFADDSSNVAIADPTKNAQWNVGPCLTGDSKDAPIVDFVKDGAKMYFYGGNSANPRYFYSATFGGNYEMRAYVNTTMTFEAPEGKVITDVMFDGADIQAQIVLGYSQIEEVEGSPKYVLYTDDIPGTLTQSPIYSKWQYHYTAPAGGVKKAQILSNGTTTKYLANFYVCYKDAVEDSAVIEIASDENAPVEYYNLQGVRVANPEKGLYIVKQGNKVSKRIIK